MKRLAASHLTGLSVLDLANNPLGDKGALELAKAPWLKNLISLKLMHCAIGTNGALALGEALDPNRLVHLELYSDLLRGQPREKVITALAPRFGRAVSV
jgi:Ran GTPase-activating protein (RanGAP) involved in mRNA processing and transport